MFLDKEVCQSIFDKVTSFIIAQAEPSYISSSAPDSYAICWAAYSCITQDGTIRKSPVGFLLSDEQVRKHEITSAFFIDKFPDELIQELVPKAGIVCGRHFLEKLQRAHTLAFVVCKKEKSSANFVANYITNSNEVARRYSLKEITNETVHG